MKSAFKLFTFLVCIAITNCAFSQTLEKFFATRGVHNLSDAAHPANDFLDGNYDVTASYVDVSIASKDNVTEGNVYTDLRLIRGGGGLYFNDILVIRDTDPWAKPFDAFKVQVQLVLIGYKALVGDAEFEKMLLSVQDTFHTDMTKWTGKMWAVFAINLDCIAYMLGR